MISTYISTSFTVCFGRLYFVRRSALLPSNFNIFSVTLLFETARSGIQFDLFKLFAIVPLSYEHSAIPSKVENRRRIRLIWGGVSSQDASDALCFALFANLLVELWR